MHLTPSSFTRPVLSSRWGSLCPTTKNQTLFSSKVQLRDHCVPEALTILSLTFHPKTKPETLPSCTRRTRWRPPYTTQLFLPFIPDTDVLV